MDARATLDLAQPRAVGAAAFGLRARQFAVALLGTALAVSSAATLAACVLALIVPQQLDEGEPLIYGLAGRLLAGQPLYQPVDQQPFVQVHYTPLYYAVVALFRELVGHGFAPGRLVSLAAGVLTATLLGYVTASLARSWWAGAFAVVAFLGLAFPGGPAPFLVLERVDMLGVGFSVAAIAVLFRGTARHHLVAAGVLAGLALLTKQSLFAAPLAGTIWLLTLDRRKAGLFVLVAAAVALIPSAGLQWSSGGAYWDNIGPANPSPTALPFGAYLFRELLVIQGIPTLLALIYVVKVRAWQRSSVRLLALYWPTTMLSVVGITKVGANHNYWIELGAANAVLAALGIWSAWRTDGRGIRAFAALVPILLLGLHVVFLGPARFVVDRPVDVIPPSWTLNVPQFMGLVRDRAMFHEFFVELRGEPGVVLGESMDAVVLGGHPVHFEPFAFSMLEYEGRWSSRPLVADICASRISLLVLTYPIDLDLHPVGLREFPMWPPSVMTALRHAMVLESARAGHWLYRPRVSPAAASVVACESAAAAVAAR